MPRGMQNGLDPLGDESLINREKLFEIVRNYRIEGLTIKENPDGSYNISFTTLSRSQEDGKKAAEDAVENDEVPTKEPINVDFSPEERMPAAASTGNVVVRVAMNVEDEKKLLAEKYPKEFLRSNGLI